MVLSFFSLFGFCSRGQGDLVWLGRRERAKGHVIDDARDGTGASGQSCVPRTKSGEEEVAAGERERGRVWRPREKEWPGEREKR